MKKKTKTARQLNSVIGKQYTHMRFAVGYLKRKGTKAHGNMGLVAMATALGYAVKTKPEAKDCLSSFYAQNCETFMRTVASRELARVAFYDSKAWLELRYQTLKRHGRKCMCCGTTEGVIQVDHIKPRSKYPELALDPDNMQVLCRDCNLGKSNKDETDWR